MAGTEHCVVLCSAPDSMVADQLAGILVEERLAACVAVLPGIRSVYVWQGKTETASEQQLLIKTRQDCLEMLKSRIRSIHPYELPEIIAVPVIDGLSGYLDWINQSVTPTP